MNYGSYLSTSGVLASMRRMDVIANNLANANTTGYKPDFVIPAERPAERVEGRSPFSDPLAPPQPILERLGGALRFDRDRIDPRQGPLEKTGLEEHLALRGRGFFALAPTSGRVRRGDPVDMTRDGALVVDRDGTLRVASNGRALLGENGRPVRIDPAQRFAVDESGRIYQNNSEVARIRIVAPRDPTTLEKRGDNILVARGPIDRVPDGEASLAQGMLEGSAADPVVSMTELIRQSRMLEANLRMIQYQDNLTGQAISGITRIA
jgi:flagellar basal body rod protein FlgG